MSDRICYFIDRKCPRCGSALASDGIHIWCSFVECTYGIDQLVWVSEEARKEDTP